MPSGLCQNSYRVGRGGAEAGQFLLNSCGPFSSLFTLVRARPIGGEVFSLFPVVGSLPRRFAHKVAARRADRGDQAPSEGSLHAPLAGIHRRFIVRC